MAFQVSPGVNISEVDLTNVVPPVSTSDAAFAAAFQWGPIDYIINVTSENQLAEIFGKPDSDIDPTIRLNELIDKKMGPIKDLGEIEKIEGSPFDAFVSFNYIEHMPNPGEIINRIYNNKWNNYIDC